MDHSKCSLSDYAQTFGLTVTADQIVILESWYIHLLQEQTKEHRRDMGLELNSQTVEDSVMGEHSESSPKKDELMPLPNLHKKKQKPQEVQFTTPSKRAVHLMGQSDSDEELGQQSVHSMDIDTNYAPGNDSDGWSSPMSLSSTGVTTHTQTPKVQIDNGLPLAQDPGFPQHSRLSLALSVVPPQEGHNPPMPTHMRMAWEASARDLEGQDEETLWVDKTAWDEKSKLSQGSVCKETQELYAQPPFSVWTQWPLMETLEEQALQTDLRALPG